MTVKFKLESRTVPDGTVLLFGIRYVGPDQEGIARPVSPPKVYTYAMIKAGEFWYVTGGGRTPQAAGWGAVERWLERDGREVVWVKAVTETVTLWPAQPPEESGQRARDESIHDDGRPCQFIAGACNLCGATPPEEPAEENCPDHPDDPGSGECLFDSCFYCGGYHCGWKCPEMA